ncbi:MAG: 3-carboxy-cis,cis-muconate cycloisomerase [Sneathiella sp.]|nr:3-carboxy-cis,cis-muconate cycloisomerase [Sneathiella sp.]
MSISPFDHPFLSGLFGDNQIAQYFSAEEDVREMLAFEAALAQAEADHGIITKDAAVKITEACSDITVDWQDLKQGTAIDGVVIPALVRQLRAKVGDQYGKYAHFGATSQDAIDTSLILRLKNLIPYLQKALVSVIEGLDELEEKFGSVELMGRTRMQRALPITASQRIRGWASPLKDHILALERLLPQLLQVQFGGAVGTLDKLGENALKVRETLAKKLSLSHRDDCWHTNRHELTNFANWLAIVSGSIGKIGQDVVLMAQNEVGEVRLKAAGGSSAMPHKQNPVQGELLMTLAKFNATQVSAMHQAVLHENERSGSSWALEWMILPQIVMTTATSLRVATELISNIEEIFPSKI